METQKIKNIKHFTFKSIIVTLCVIFGILTMVGGYFLIDKVLIDKDPIKYNRQEVKESEIELEFWGNKFLLVKEIDKYIKSIAPNTNISSLMLLNICDKYNVDVRLAIVQGQQESHFGTKGLAAKTNNVWNRGAFDGKKFEQIDSIYICPHPNESIEPYVKLIKKDYLGGTKTEKDLLRKFVNLRGQRYASSELYEAELSTLMDKINNTTKLDSLINVHIYFKKELGI